jgi:hypothetical protein
VVFMDKGLFTDTVDIKNLLGTMKNFAKFAL